MRATIGSLRDLMGDACQAASVPKDKAAFVVEHYLAGELRGRTSHGIAKFCFESRFFPQREGSPQIVRDQGALAVIDARREIGPISAAYAVDVAVGKAADLGAGIIGMINTQRYGILAQWSERIAEHGYLGIVMNTSRAEATVHRGRTPVLGVNPLSFAIPTLDEPIVADMSTTLAPMGVLWEARRTGGPLPPGCFVDEHGNPTDDPHAATSAVVFGEHRGLALSLLLQILTGSLFAFPMGAAVKSTWSTGYTFLALDPSFGGQVTGFPEHNTQFADAIRSAVTRDGAPMRLPGQASKERADHALATGTVELDDAVFRRLQARAAGDFASD
ncbi:Ldh family oxidoreductase [Streptomyces doebereineriae]|uniref:Ldh family oxidoreductase n=1 Tax=Streptomyces doebereineriae TaxID=3075528 RepID=A0ABU2VI86_9ACTN|nr:Ldh family oxidoreductase [Streptomyces sp. DSM 41640]MDT0485300.1 Ldh family oxidoreductase [Streptomyces sp. DSM 41640]